MYTILIILTICPNLILYLISVGNEIMMVHQLSPHFQIIHNWTRTSSNWKYYRVNKKEISTSASWTSDRMEFSLDMWWNEEKKIPFLLYPEIGQGNPNRNDISDLHMEFFFCQMLISYSIDYNEHKTMIIRERSKIQIFSLSMIPINPFKFHCTFDNIESRYNRLVVSIAIFFSLFFFIFFSDEFKIIPNYRKNWFFLHDTSLGSYLYNFSLVMFSCFVDHCCFQKVIEFDMKCRGNILWILFL